MTQVIISLFDGAAPICLPVNEHNNTVEQIKHSVYNLTSIPVQDQVLNSMGGLMLMDKDAFDLQHPVHFLNLSGRLLGGKGGFGSMLRAQGGRMNAQKTTNFEACRDLQGRRIKTVNDAKKLQEELDALPEREAEKREKLKRKIEDALKEREPRKYLFDDNEFLEDKEEMVESVKSAVGSAIKRQKVTHKPVASSSAAAAAAAASMFDDDVSSDEDEDGEEEDEEEEEEEQAEEKVEEEQVPQTKKTTKAKGKGKAKA